MSRLIQGEFLNAKETHDGYFFGEYVIEKKLCWFKIKPENLESHSQYAKNHVDKLEVELQLLPGDSIERENIVSRIDSFLVESLLTEMYIAFRKGEDLKKYFENSKESKILNIEKLQIKEIMEQQILAFQEQYDIRKYEIASEKDQDTFIIQLKHYIKKFETAEKLKTAHLSLKNSLIKFTEIEIFQYEAQLETVKILLPFLRTQLELAHSMLLPKVRNTAILPLGTITAGEILYMIAEEIPKVAELSEKERIELVNQSVQETAKLVTTIDPNAYIMDTTTLNSLKEQQRKENEDKYQETYKKWQEVLTQIANISTTTPNSEKVKLQQKSVDLGIRFRDFCQWFTENKLPIPRITTEDAVKPEFLELCKNECERLKLKKGETIKTAIKYSIAKTIQLTELPDEKEFKSGNPAYHRLSKMLSILGYSKKTSTERN